MTGKTISPLRQRMIEDMTVRSFDLRTQRGYILAVRKLTAFLGHTPDTAMAYPRRPPTARSLACGSSSRSRSTGRR